MPTTRRRRTRDFKGGVARLELWMEKGLLTGEEDPSAPEWDRFGFFCGTAGMVPGICLSMGEAWTHYGQGLLETWRRVHPGTRPFAWWRFDAPGARQRVGGAEEDVDGLTLADLDHGLPCDECHVIGYDPEEPPMYESQATFLERHGLLTAAERRALEKYPQAFEPEVLILEAEEIE